ncbi:phospholipase, patatin family protein [Myriangium duriaei CBS 260.36]|uniref:Phospholipase, patatin family protein n=1 Tax=Myriangium duriaei CBS 260.36 TaxID=1168546 RepID=A0A9P4MBW2_9PEZI|nr:phospholipase, patatin family protein [Myriangium duriaei CBS 260.36]
MAPRPVEPGDLPSAPTDGKRLCLLSLDGGGVRGLSSLYILKRIMDELNRQRKVKGLGCLKPCEVFDLIGGTCSGGLFAIMLGRLQLDVDDCIELWSQLVPEVFALPPFYRLPISITGNVQPKYDSNILDSCIRDVMLRRGLTAEETLLDDSPRRCRSFVCVLKLSTQTVARFRDYNIRDDYSKVPKIREAALATSATTAYFDRVMIGNDVYIDGSLGANNPVEEVEHEATNIWAPTTRELKPLVKCFLSIGAGSDGKRYASDTAYSALSFFTNVTMKVASGTEATEKRFADRWYDGRRYFRFNVQEGLRDVGFDEHTKLGLIAGATEDYLLHPAQRFNVIESRRHKRWFR